jgi:superfamily II DNA helicase RecQ
MHALSLAELKGRLRISIPSQLQPGDDFLDALSDVDQIIAIKACLLTWEVSRNFDTQNCLRPWQIEAILASINNVNTNSIINVGTGQGKSLCAILPQLLFPNSVTIVISPLKRLMASQVKEYQYWGIRRVMTILGKHSDKLTIAGRIEPDRCFFCAPPVKGQKIYQTL